MGVGLEDGKRVFAVTDEIQEPTGEPIESPGAEPMAPEPAAEIAPEPHSNGASSTSPSGPLPPVEEVGPRERPAEADHRRQVGLGVRLDGECPVEQLRVVLAEPDDLLLLRGGAVPAG